MATPPTFVTEYEVTWTSTGASTAKTISVTVDVGDLLVVLGGTEQGGLTLGTPTGGGLTYTSRQAAVPGPTWSTAYIWTAPSASAQTFTLSITNSAQSGEWGYNVLRYSAHGGVGASNNGNVSGAAPSLGLTTTGDNSAIAIFNADWNATDGTSRTWRSVNGAAATEQSYYRNSASYAAYAGRHVDAAAAGAKTVGLSAPTGQKHTTVAVEILGTSSAFTPPPIAQVTREALTRSHYW